MDSPSKHRRIVVLAINLLLGNIILLWLFHEKPEFPPFIGYNLAALLLLPWGMRAIKKTMGGLVRAVWGFLLTALVCWLGAGLLFLSVGLVEGLTPPNANTLLNLLVGIILPIVLAVPVFFGQGFYLYTLPMAVVNAFLFARYLHGRDNFLE